MSQLSKVAQVLEQVDRFLNEKIFVFSQEYLEGPLNVRENRSELNPKATKQEIVDHFQVLFRY
jgi:hypothetical protein